MKNCRPHDDVVELIDILNNLDARPIFLIGSEEMKRLPNKVEDEIDSESIGSKLTAIQNVLDLVSEKVDKKAKELVEEVRSNNTKTFAEVAMLRNQPTLNVINSTRKRSRIDDTVEVIEDNNHSQGSNEVFKVPIRRGFLSKSPRKSVEKTKETKGRRFTVTGSATNNCNMAANYDIFVLNVKKGSD